ncbi:proteasome subunit alpha type-2 [Drosophila mojavensis]|uniref:Uncharacterized protein n=1 Tax=Drosophila mojavensis TaxID=7230 RepID=B4L506_DROMO|nr:proteasome subunit alpha type-2 [Drosophila mojavensis]EDW06265.1 uncharacterized protein Dmoj_GI21618 [Drosophila mojavensis]
MYSSDIDETNRYCYNLCTFNPFGEVKQVDYANTCAMKGEPAVGIVTLDGVVLGTQKRLKLKYAIGESVEKVKEIGPTMGITFSGLFPDFRIITKLYRKTIAEFSLVHDHPLPVHCLMRSVSTSMQELTQSTGVRPFGLSLLLAGFSDNRGQLYFMDAAGSNSAYKACAIGRHMHERTIFLEKKYRKRMDAEDGVSLAVQALMLRSPRGLSADQMEVAVVEDYGMYRIDEETIAKYM